MKKLVELTSKDHSNLKVAMNCAIKAIKDQHIIAMNVTEAGAAVSTFPVFLIKPEGAQNWSMSGITSLEVGGNLFVKDELWDGSYIADSMQTYPFYLMQKKEGENSFTIGIDPENEAFSEETGEPLFESEGEGESKATAILSDIAKRLEGSVQKELHTIDFAKTIDELDLIRPLDLSVVYQDGRVNTLKGLSSIDEKKLQELPLEDFDKLRKKGYLPAVYAMFISVYQLNNLIKRHNDVFPDKRVVEVKINLLGDEQASDEKNAEEKTSDNK